MTVIVALAVMAATEDPLRGAEHSPNLLILFGGLLGAVMGRLVSDAFRFGFVGGILFGVFGYLTAVVARSLGIRIGDTPLFFLCVSAGGVVGGVIGGLVPTVVPRWRQLSFRSRIRIVLVGFCLLVTLVVRWRTVREQARLVAEIKAAGGGAMYSDVNPFPTIFDSQRISGSEWVRQLLGLRVVTNVTLREHVDDRYDVQLLVDVLPGLEGLQIHAGHLDDEAIELLNSGKLSQLERLCVFGRGFGDTSLAKLHAIASLAVLDLEGTSVTDTSIEHIATFPRLQILNVRKTEISADGVKRLESTIGLVESSN